VFVLQLLQEPDQVSFALLNMMTAVLAQVCAGCSIVIQQQQDALRCQFSWGGQEQQQAMTKNGGFQGSIAVVGVLQKCVVALAVATCDLGMSS
jgi:hypothetical protein